MNEIPDLKHIDVKDMSGQQIRFFREIAIELQDGKFLRKLKDETNRYFKYDY